MSFSFYLEDLLCGPEPGKDNIAIIPMKACDKDLPNHLFGLGVSRSTRPEICRKAEVLFNRGGFIFPTDKKNHARENVRKQNSCKGKPKEKIYTHDGPHFDIKPEL